MTKATKPQKVAILGGGMGGLATAYNLSNRPAWQDDYDITVYQLGWRLGGKCASSRGENARIEEHGIHGFVGSYFNAIPMMHEVYAELNRPAGAPLATFDEAFIPSNFAMMWEYENGGLKPWPTRFPENKHSAIDPSDYKGLESSITSIIFEVQSMLDAAKGVPKIVELAIGALLGKAADQCREIPLSEGPNHPLVGEIKAARKLITGVVDTVDRFAPGILEHWDDLRHALMTLDFYSTMILGALEDNVVVNGYDGLDDENWSDWLIRHGIDAATLKSPVVMITVNICYQSPNGDTSRAARMAAGAFLDWTLRTCAYREAFLWSFAAGSGETVVAPMYEVLKRRGVKFEFFHKVDALHIDPRDRRSIESVEFTLQATLKDPARGYEPLIEVKGLPSWPHRPLYEQLVEGEYMRALCQDLESYWCPWPTAEFPYLKQPRTLRRGKDFDQVVFAISLGAVPFLCKELMQESPRWADMVANIPSVQTQAMQLWLSKDLYELGWQEKLDPAKHEVPITGTYFCPPNGNAEFHDLLKWEDWPADNSPKALWYFCGLMPDYEPMPPFSDHEYPARQAERVKAQCIQYLQASIGTMLPNATVRANNPIGDPMGLDFDLLVDTRDVDVQGVHRFDSQFWRANIDPTERYVTTPPGSVKHRMEAWGSGFDNLTLAGDWIYTGLNVGSFEGATMSGKLASHAIAGYPALATVIGYPTVPRPDATAVPPPASAPTPHLRLVG
ncbi:NAD(P)-binding protein [Phenylobacterium sp.]|uniref:NAD(P)/FAD-dependent oxidoreductase n=1 Tax=Phenylobacterium sp. TaxID=1871053 RepID=UPI0025ECF2CE|nr:NAD(P)-binding protein [Phenylobacterium sp.]MBX3482234.1 NAD(P)-binding protein [Phenylobacterium sp.]MCW5758416.1 NAD(P)-binding protein [Phenylobacterium sp.]